jgi:hypothetical protein
MSSKHLEQLVWSVGTYLQILRKDIFATGLKANSNVVHFNYVSLHSEQTGSVNNNSSMWLLLDVITLASDPVCIHFIDLFNNFLWH